MVAAVTTSVPPPCSMTSACVPDAAPHAAEIDRRVREAGRRRPRVARVAGTAAVDDSRVAASVGQGRVHAGGIVACVLDAAVTGVSAGPHCRRHSPRPRRPDPISAMSPGTRARGPRGATLREDRVGVSSGGHRFHCPGGRPRAPLRMRPMCAIDSGPRANKVTVSRSRTPDDGGSRGRVAARPREVVDSFFLSQRGAWLPDALGLLISDDYESIRG